MCLWIINVVFIIPYWTLSFINTLGEEFRPWYQLHIYKYATVDAYYLITMIFKLVLSITTCATFLLLRHRDVVLHKFRKAQAAQGITSDSASNKSESVRL